MHSVSLQYSLDGGTNWSTYIAYNVLSFTLDMNPETETEGSESRRMGTAAAKCVKVTPRYQGKISFAWSNFNMAKNSSGNTNMKALQMWACAPLRRVYFAGCSKHVPGAWDLFDANNNTNYVDVTSIDYEYKRMNSNTSNANGDKIVGVSIEYEVRSAPTLTKWNGTSFV